MTSLIPTRTDQARSAAMTWNPWAMINPDSVMARPELAENPARAVVRRDGPRGGTATTVVLDGGRGGVQRIKLVCEAGWTLKCTASPDGGLWCYCYKGDQIKAPTLVSGSQSAIGGLSGNPANEVDLKCPDGYQISCVPIDTTSGTVIVCRCVCTDADKCTLGDLVYPTVTEPSLKGAPLSAAPPAAGPVGGWVQCIQKMKEHGYGCSLKEGSAWSWGECSDACKRMAGWFSSGGPSGAPPSPPVATTAVLAAQPRLPLPTPDTRIHGNGVRIPGQPARQANPFYYWPPQTYNYGPAPYYPYEPYPNYPYNYWGYNHWPYIPYAVGGGSWGRRNRRRGAHFPAGAGAGAFRGGSTWTGGPGAPDAGLGGLFPGGGGGAQFGGGGGGGAHFGGSGNPWPQYNPFQTQTPVYNPAPQGAPTDFG